MSHWFIRSRRVYGGGIVMVYVCGILVISGGVSDVEWSVEVTCMWLSSFMWGTEGWSGMLLFQPCSALSL